MRNSEVASGSFGHADVAVGSFDPMQSQQADAAYASAAPYSHSSSPYQAASPYQQASPQYQGSSFGPLFRELRRALGLTLPTAASFAGTRIEVVVALESGDLAALPPWPETVRVVTQLTSLAQIDPGPVLGLIHQEMVQARAQVTEAFEATARAAAPVVGAPLPTMMQAWAGDEVPVGRPQGRPGRVPPSEPPRSASTGDDETLLERTAALASRTVQALKSISVTGRIVALSAVLIAAGGTIAQGSAFKASFATLQTPISRLLQGAENYLIWRSAPVKDGLRWINVDDPRSRKGDKLRVNKPDVS